MKKKIGKSKEHQNDRLNIFELIFGVWLYNLIHWPSISRKRRKFAKEMKNERKKNQQAIRKMQKEKKLYTKKVNSIDAKKLLDYQKKRTIEGSPAYIVSVPYLTSDNDFGTIPLEFNSHEEKEAKKALYSLGGSLAHRYGDHYNMDWDDMGTAIHWKLDVKKKKWIRLKKPVGFDEL